MKLKYIGGADVRVITPDEWKTAGITHEETSWDIGNKYSAEVSDEAAHLLTEIEPNDWLVSSKGAKEEKPKEDKG